MKPGSELDLLVAENIMGKYWGGANNTIPAYLREGLLPYSTDIAAAFEVVEKMKTEFKNFELRTLRLPHGHEKYICYFNAFYGKASESAPHAICLAALKAKGVKIE